MIQFSFIWHNAQADLKNGDGRIAILTQTALLFFLFTLTLTSASIQEYLSDNLDQMLGSDMVLESHVPFSPEAETTLKAKSAAIARIELVAITMAHVDRWQRVQLKLVGTGYPLQGALMVGRSPASPQRPVTEGPAKGEIWLGPRLASKLGLSVGDSVAVAGETLRVAAILFHEPDRLMEGHSVALRAMVHRDSISPEGLASSKRRFRYLVEADESQLEAIENWAMETMPGVSMVKKDGGAHPLSGFWKRTENFLGLASVILFFMAAVATDMTNRRWLERMRYQLAIYMSFGVKLKTGLIMAGMQWFIGFLFAFAVASILAAGAYLLILAELQAYFPGLSAGWHLGAVFKTCLLVFGLLLALQAPTFIQLRHSSILSLIRTLPEGRFIWHRLVWGLLAVTALAAFYSDNLLLTGLTLGAMAAALALMIVVSWVVLRLGDLWGSRRSGLLPFAFFMMRQRIFAKSAQILGLGLCGLLLLFTLMLMRDLGSMMESYGRQHDGNLLISEAQENQMDAIKNWAQETGSSIRQLRPFVSAQLVRINGLTLEDYMQKPSDTMATVKDPIRLSWADEMPANNQLAGGDWWQHGTANWQQISTEPEVMTDLGLSYGDTLTYRIGRKSYDFTLVASHAYKPGNGSITFWFQVPISARQHIEADTRFMGSMELPQTAWSKLAPLWQQYPTLALVPLKELTERFDKMLAIVTRVTSGYAGMVLVLALFVLAASVSGFRADDQQKNGLLMSMGLRQQDCLKLNFYDWFVTALIAATGAVAGTWIAGVMMYEAQFGLAYNPSIVWVTATIIMMIAAVCTIGFLACRQSLRVSVRDLLNG